MVKKSIIFEEKELLGLLGEIITEQNYEDDFDKTMSYKDYLKKYNLKDNEFIKKRYTELVGKTDTKVSVVKPKFGSCYELVESPGTVWSVNDGKGNYVLEQDDELSGWDTGEETFEIKFKVRPLKNTSPLVQEYGEPAGGMLKMVIKQNDRTPDIGWEVNTSSRKEAAQGTSKSNYEVFLPKDEDVTITLKIPSNPMTWHEKAEAGEGVYNWPRFYGKGESDSVVVTANIDFYVTRTYSGRNTSKPITDTCQAHLYVYSEFTLGSLGEVIQKSFIESSPWDTDGQKDWDKSAWNPKNWDKHLIIDLIAIAALIIAGFFSGGTGWVAAAAWGLSMGTYVSLTAYNALLYYQEGNMEMAGIHLLFEALPYVKFTKRLAGLSAKAYNATLKKAFTAIKNMTGFTLKSNKNALKILKGSPLAADMVKALAKYGDDAIKHLDDVLKKGAKTSDITDDVAKEFLQTLTKEAPDLAKLIKKAPGGGIQLSKQIIAEQTRTFMSRMAKTLSAGGNMIGDALILATLYDTDMLWEPFQKFALGVKDEDIKSSGIPGIRDLQDWSLTKLNDYYDSWKPRDLVVLTKDENGKNYNWQNVRSLYIASITNPLVGRGECGTIPSERYTQLYKKYKFEPSKEERMDYDSKQELGSGGSYQGIPIEGSKMLGKSDVNIALKEDWLAGWRPEQNCHEYSFSFNTATEMKNRENLPAIEEDEVWYKNYMEEGLEKYYNETGGYLSLGGVEMTPEPTDKALNFVNKLDDESRACLIKTMDIYIDWVVIPEGDVDFETPSSPCIDNLK